jgi:hypothetical protein
MFVLPAALPAGAPPSARLLAWALAATIAENFGATLLRRPLEPGANASAPWEALLGLDRPLDGEAAAEEALQRRAVPLPGWRGVRYDEDALRRGEWWALFNAPANCGAVFEAPQEARVWDALGLSKAAAAAKFARARAAGADAPLLWAALSAPGSVHIAVHARRVRVGSGDAAGEAAAAGAEAAHDAWWDTPHWQASWRPLPQPPGGWLYCPTPDAVLARVVQDAVLPAFAAADPAQALRLHVHVFTQLLEGERGEEALPALAALGAAPQVAGVNFYGPAQADGWATLLHLASADVLVGSASQWSVWAAHFSSVPVVLAQPDTSRARVCGEGQACCLATGACPFAAQEVMAAAARRIAAREQCRGAPASGQAAKV